MDDQRERGAAIGGALAAARLGDEDGTLREVGRIATLGDSAMRDSVWDLAEDSGDLLGLLMNDLGDNALVDLELLHRDGSPLSVDQLDPALRAAVRMLLSLANGRHEDAREQLDLVAAERDPAELAIVFVHLLMWTVQLQDVCASMLLPERLEAG